MGLALARLVCDEAGIRAGAGGTTVILRMSLQARRARAAVTGQGAGVLPAPCVLRFGPAGRAAGTAGCGIPAGRDFCRKGA